jgi:hypothetical protein
MPLSECQEFFVITRSKMTAILSIKPDSVVDNKGTTSADIYYKNVLSHAEEATEQKADSVDVYPLLGVMYVEGKKRQIEKLLEDPSVSTATTE